jgi:hypothetical protein
MEKKNFDAKNKNEGDFKKKWRWVRRATVLWIALWDGNAILITVREASVPCAIRRVRPWMTCMRAVQKT